MEEGDEGSKLIEEGADGRGRGTIDREKDASFGGKREFDSVGFERRV